MENRATAEDSPVARYRDWLRRTTMRLYRHDVTVDVDGWMQDLGPLLEEATQVVAPEDLAGHLPAVLGSATLERLREAATTSPAEPGAAAAPSPEVMAKVERVMAALQAEHQELVGLHLQGLSREELAFLNGWSADDVRNRVNAALKDLQEWLSAVGIESATD